MGMKISVSLPAEEVEFLDEYAAVHGIRSRSAALSRAIRSLRALDLSADYADAWKEWAEESEQIWTVTAPDGITA